MDAKYKIMFKGEFKSWVNKEEFVTAFSEQLGTSREKATALYELKRKVNLKKHLSDTEADRHKAAFEKMGMVVTKKLMFTPPVGQRIEPGSRGGYGDNSTPSESYLSLIRHGKKEWSGLTHKLKSLIRKTDT